MNRLHGASAACPRPFDHGCAPLSPHRALRSSTRRSSLLSSLLVPLAVCWLRCDMVRNFVVQVNGQGGLAENSAIWNRLSSFRELLHQNNDVFGSDLSASMSHQDSFSCAPTDEYPAQTQDRTPDFGVRAHLLGASTPEGHPSWGDSSVRMWEEPAWASHGGPSELHPPFLSSDSFSVGQMSAGGGAGVSPTFSSLFAPASPEQISHDRQPPVLFGAYSDGINGGPMPEDPAGAAPTPVTLEEPGEAGAEGETSTTKSSQDADPEVGPQFCADEVQRSLAGSTLHNRYSPEPWVVAQP